MFLTFEVIATFGVSAVISFAISSAILLLVAAKKGMLCAGRPAKQGADNLNSVPLMPPTPKDVLAGEETPLQSSQPS
ncbi:hypothetical protein MSG28_006025 [Choristoneura fumiferana]|uniref:Uncharacterized protein n=1 Tax=Choristoneura fumiferana TaxID=7141 RepID=A0ACC0L185_CHOFU|nr:hypothetical protein MSG28_006025 [Choristoneura fumiferana]